MAERLPSRASGFTCREVVDLVTEYLEGAMSADEITALELHLHYCDGCATYLDQIRETVALARGVSGERISDELKDALRLAYDELGRG
jgi:anti-sigma factor RsiW